MNSDILKRHVCFNQQLVYDVQLYIRHLLLPIPGVCIPIRDHYHVLFPCTASQLV